MRTPLLSLSLLTLIACKGDTGGDSSSGGGGDDSSGSGHTGDTQDTGTAPQTASGIVRGTVTVLVSRLDESGNTEVVSVDEAYPEGFPYGAIFLAATTTDDDGIRSYHATDTISSPSSAGDPYELSFTLDEAGRVEVFGQLDYWHDGIMGSGEPVGVVDERLYIEDGSELNADITIVADEIPESGGGGGCSSITLSGDVNITQSWSGGNGVVMVNDAAGGGPYHYAWFTPTATTGGAEASYAMSACFDWGPMNVEGAVDSNLNGLIDNADQWGTYVSGADTPANPIAIGQSDQSGVDVQIPLSSRGLSVVPYVRVSGTLLVSTGSFDDLPAGTGIIVAALEDDVSGDVSITTLEDDAYDFETYAWTKLSGQTEVKFSLTVPAKKTIYLKAYADTDNDSTYNEAGEPLAWVGTDDGQLYVGATNSTDNKLVFSIPE